MINSSLIIFSFVLHYGKDEITVTSAMGVPSTKFRAITLVDKTQTVPAGVEIQG